MLQELDEQALLDIFSGVPKFNIPKSDIEAGINAIELLSTSAPIFSSKGEARKMLQANGVSVNKTKIGDKFNISEHELLKDKYVIVQKGKKDYYLLIVK
jgi:tyrosyl-tRNA synthetase